MKRATLVTGCLACVLAVESLHAQGTFQNLDFESANLSPVPAGQFGGLVPFTQALPGWTGYIGEVQQTQVQQNAYYSGTPVIDIFGPDWGSLGQNFQRFGVLAGNYTVLLQAGGFGDANTSIEQTGTIPASAESLQFEEYGSGFQVSFDGSVLSPVLLSTVGPVSFYGADISAFAGQSGELELTALVSAGASVEFDDISFSTTAVSEPGVLSLLGMGGLIFALHRWRRCLGYDRRPRKIV
jgi:hypothetical protein